jgi:hypothetical protein
MIAMMKFFYQKEYFPPRDDSLTPLRFLATVYQVADKYLVPQLKEHSIEKFRYVLKKDWNFNDPDNFDDFLSATALIYESTPQSDRGLRDLVVDKALECLSNFGERKGFQELLHNTMWFASDLVLKVAKYRVQGMCTSCTWVDPCYCLSIFPENVVNCFFCGKKLTLVRLQED